VHAVLPDTPDIDSYEEQWEDEIMKNPNYKYNDYKFEKPTGVIQSTFPSLAFRTLMLSEPKEAGDPVTRSRNGHATLPFFRCCGKLACKQLFEVLMEIAILKRPEPTSSQNAKIDKTTDKYIPLQHI